MDSNHISTLASTFTLLHLQLYLVLRMWAGKWGENLMELLNIDEILPWLSFEIRQLHSRKGRLILPLF